MARSLSVLLPVKNAQSTLAPTVHGILDVVSELSEQVELLIIDDGSADATSEVAMELTRHYPQVKAICQGRSSGREAAIRSGLQKSTGEISLILEEEQGTPLGDIVKSLKTSKTKGRFYFRLDGGKEHRKAKLPQQHQILEIFDNTRIAPRHDAKKTISSRPARPNFMERLKGIVFDE